MVSQKPWSFLDGMQLFFRVMVTLLAGLMLVSLVETSKSWPQDGWVATRPVIHQLVGAMRSWSQDTREFVETVLMVVFFQGSVLFWTRKFLKEKQITVREAFFRGRRDGRAILIGLGAGIVAAVAGLYLEGALVDFADKFLHWKLENEEIVERLGSSSISLASQIFLGATAIVLAPIAEEPLFRGLLYPTIKQSGYPRLALLGTSVLFGLAHFNVAVFIPLTLFAMMQVWLYEITDNLLAPVMAHFALNTINFVFILYSGQSGANGH